jgi:hypothetical protein
MNKILLDSTMRKKLRDLKEPLELCDESGNVLAELIPRIDLSEYDCTEPPISEEELRRRENSTEWYTTKEVLDYLEKL